MSDVLDPTAIDSNGMNVWEIFQSNFEDDDVDDDDTYHLYMNIEHCTLNILIVRPERECLLPIASLFEIGIRWLNFPYFVALRFMLMNGTIIVKKAYKQIRAHSIHDYDERERRRHDERQIQHMN